MKPSLQALLAFLFVVLGASAMLLMAEPLTLATPGAGADLDLRFRLILSGGLVLLAVAGLAWLRERPGGGGGPVVASALPAGVIAVAGMLLILWAGGHAVRGDTPAPAAGRLIGGAMLILLAVFAEELLLRGLLQPVLMRSMGPLAAIALTAVAFMLVHVVGGWRDPVSLLNIFLGGVWFGLLAWRSGGLIAPVLAHFGYNAAEDILFGASPNPGVGQFGALWDIDIVGSAAWGGSGDGLNASLLLSIMLAALIAPLLYRRESATKVTVGA
jgi:membrane protease YdiL (CAAX protease family)